MVDNTRVHITHCCVTHGCKYGDEDCPVANKKVAQSYSCEECVAYNMVDKQYKRFDSAELEKANNWYRTMWNKLSKEEKIIMYWDSNPDHVN